jgi:hypothetical protein
VLRLRANVMPRTLDNKRSFFTVEVTIPQVYLPQPGDRGRGTEMVFEMQETIERELVQERVGERTRGAISRGLTAIVFNEVADTNQKDSANIYREHPVEEHRRESANHETEAKKRIQTHRKDQIIRQQLPTVTVLGKMAHVPPDSIRRPHDQIPERIERRPMFRQGTDWIDLWNLRKTMMLQMDRFEGMEIHQIDRTQQMPGQDVGLGTRKHIVV